MKKFKSLVLAVMGLLCCMSVSAEDFEVDGIYYNITSQADKTVAVTYRGDYDYSYSNEYSGEVTIPESVTYNEDTYSVTSIGNGAFWYCSSLTSVTIPNSVTSIGDYAFSGPSSLTSVEIPNNVTSIGDYAFWDCSSLTSVEIGDSVTSIGDYAFNGCSSLTSVEIGNSVTSIGKGAFSYCSRLTSMVVAPNNTKYDSRDNCNAIIESESNTLIAGCSNTTIPNSVTSIGYAAFSSRTSLTSVKIPNSVTSIGDGAFYECSSLTSVELGKSVETIGQEAFSDCVNLKKLISYAEVPPVCGSRVFDGVNTQECTLQVPRKSMSAYQQAAQWKEFYMTVGIHDFKVDGIYYNITTDNTVAVTYRGSYYDSYSNEYSGEVKIPESVTYNGNAYGVTSIGESAFRYCSRLTSVEIPNSVTSIGGYAFWDCSSLTSVVIGNGVTSIDDYAFSWCSSLTSVEIGNSVTSIGDWAFYKCSGLTSVEIGNSVTRIGDYAFEDCSGLTSVVISNGVTSIGDWAFYKCSGLTSVEIPNSVTIIGCWAFSNCSGLTSVVIGNGVTSIGGYAFEDCSGLTSVVIGNGVTSIGDDAFRDCENLKKLISYAEVPPVCHYWGVFYGVNTQECTLQVPEKSISAYQQADQWKEFFLIEGVPTAIGGVTVEGAVPATADVYSTNGMLVKRNADLKNLKHELPAGLYIIGGKKVWVK